MMKDKPGIGEETFEILLKENWADAKILYTVSYGMLEVVSVPKKKMWHKVIQFITFGVYKAPWSYIVKKI